MRYKKELAVGLAAVSQAARLCRRIQNDLLTAGRVEKSDHSPVTIADFASQTVITARLMEHFEADRLIAEENAGLLRKNEALSRQVLNLTSEINPKISQAEMWDLLDAGNIQDSGGSRFWTIDPIDGTKGFLRGDQYAIALALIEEGEVVLGILGCPNFQPSGRWENPDEGSMLSAVKDGGTRLISMATGQSEPVRVTPIGDIKAARLCESVETAHASHEVHEKILRAIGITASRLRIDSQTKYAAVATGEAAIYLRKPRTEDYREKIWDHAAGSIVVTEAGGEVTDFKGVPLDFSHGRTLKHGAGILATNGQIHGRVLEGIRKVLW